MLTHRDLKTIQEGNRRHPDVMMLLREVKRLRDLAALTYSTTADLPHKRGMGIHQLGIPVQRDHSFWLNVTADSGAS